MLTFVSMLQQVISFSDFEFSSKLIQNLTDSDEGVKDFINDFFSFENIHKITESKSFSDHQRIILVEALNDQNINIERSRQTEENIALLKNTNSYAVTTGHQLNLLTGPLYSIYKVAQVIRITQELNTKYTDKNFIPIFWMATEDHDFEEINHINLFGKKYVWNHEDNEGKVVGRISTNSIAQFIEEVKACFSNPNDLEKLEGVFTHLSKVKNLAEATRGLMNYFFGEYGLVIIDGDDRNLKMQFESIAEKEILSQVTLSEVGKTNKKLTEAGYHNQVFLRNANLFYINEEGVRERISYENKQWAIGDEEITQNKLLAKLKSKPESFSPNALLRPVYQETVLPNVAYVGGGGEIGYWMQLKTLFNELELQFPLLVVRDSFLLLKEREINLLKECKLSIKDLKSNVNELFKDRVKKEIGGTIIYTEIEKRVEELKKMALKKASLIDKGAIQSVESTFTRVMNDFEKLEDRLIKGMKNKDENQINKLLKLKHKIFPNGGFQERYENVLSYFVNDPDFIEKIVGFYPDLTEPKINIINYP